MLPPVTRERRSKVRQDTLVRSLHSARRSEGALVKLRPKSTTVAAVNRLPMPHPTPTRRNTALNAGGKHARDTQHLGHVYLEGS
jgi:hypothetical protein